MSLIETHLGYIRDDISRLEKKQDKYNTLQERTLTLEVEHRGLDSRVRTLEAQSTGGKR